MSGRNPPHQTRSIKEHDSKHSQRVAHRRFGDTEQREDRHRATRHPNGRRGNSATAITAAERAVELAPNQDFGRAFGGFALAQDGQLLEAAASIRQAFRLNPRANTGLLHGVAIVNYFAGREKEAAELWEQAREASSDLITVRIFLASYDERYGQHDRASAIVGEILRVRADFTVEDGIELIHGVERTERGRKLAQIVRDRLRKAGLP